MLMHMLMQHVCAKQMIVGSIKSRLTEEHNETFVPADPVVARSVSNST